MIKELHSEGAKVVPLFIKSMAPADQCNMAQTSKDCHNEVTKCITSLQDVIKRHHYTCGTTVY